MWIQKHKSGMCRIFVFVWPKYEIGIGLLFWENLFNAIKSYNNTFNAIKKYVFPWIPSILIFDPLNDITIHKQLNSS
jgi:hypothetical protein